MESSLGRVRTRRTPFSVPALNQPLASAGSVCAVSAASHGAFNLLQHGLLIVMSMSINNPCWKKLEAPWKKASMEAGQAAAGA